MKGLPMNFKTRMQKIIHRAQLYPHEAVDAKVWTHLKKKRNRLHTLVWERPVNLYYIWWLQCFTVLFSRAFWRNKEQTTYFMDASMTWTGAFLKLSAGNSWNHDSKYLSFWYLVYCFYSKIPSQKGLVCKIWAQIMSVSYLMIIGWSGLGIGM